jgi:hypothetical protein
MVRSAGIRCALIGLAFLASLAPLQSLAQDDPNDVPLGDVARNLRRKSTSGVIDDDNLPEVMHQAESRKGFGSSLRFLMAGEANGFQIAVPDATCSLSFNSNAKSLLSSQYAQMDLPSEDLPKLEARATIEGDALTLPVRNGTDWHVSEIVVALTVVSKHPSVMDLSGGAAAGIPDALGSTVRPEKRPDTTLIYRMRAPAAPFATTVFSRRLNQDLDPGDEWHWAIVAAKGYPPETYSAEKSQNPAPQPSRIAFPSFTDFQGPVQSAPETPQN